MHSTSGRSSRSPINAWPGWVDALSSLIMVVIFLLLVFVVSQFYLATALSGRDEAMTTLNQKISELADLLGLERKTSADLRRNVSQLTDELQAALAAREEMTGRLNALQTERDDLSARATALTQRTETGAAQLQQIGRDLEDAYKAISADREKIDLQLREIASLQTDIATLREMRDKLEKDVATLAAAAQTNEAERARLSESLRLTEEQRQALLSQIGAYRDRTKELEARLVTQQERTALTQKEIDQRDIRIKELLGAAEASQATLASEQERATRGQQQITLLNQQIAALRDQLAAVSAALEISETKNKEQQAQIANLGSRLNVALASKVEELARYRSEFFGRLREALGNRPDIRIVGDRFVFQSEVLFPTGSATLEEQGMAQLAELARTLLEIAQQIPPEVNWILRVDGHTDRRPIYTAQFPSNWELSTARAISVVKFLIDQGIPAERLVAAGFGEFQPLDASVGDDAFGRNRRIELKLDQR